MNQQNAKKYEDQFNSDFAEYEKMKPAIDQVCAVFDSLEKDMRRCKEGTKEFKEIYKSAMNEYKRQVQKGNALWPSTFVTVHFYDRPLLCRQLLWLSTFMAVYFHAV